MISNQTAAIDVAVQLGHTDGGELVRKVYGHPAPRHSLDRVRGVLDGAACVPAPQHDRSMAQPVTQ